MTHHRPIVNTVVASLALIEQCRSWFANSGLPRNWGGPVCEMILSNVIKLSSQTGFNYQIYSIRTGHVKQCWSIQMVALSLRSIKALQWHPNTDVKYSLGISCNLLVSSEAQVDLDAEINSQWLKRRDLCIKDESSESFIWKDAQGSKSPKLYPLEEAAMPNFTYIFTFR